MAAVGMSGFAYCDTGCKPLHQDRIGFLGDFASFALKLLTLPGVVIAFFALLLIPHAF
jgi:hypothetical protein